MQLDDPFVLARNALDEHPRVLAIGSSHLWTGIDPREIRHPTVNLSHASNDYTMIERTLRTGLELSPEVRCVVIELGIVPLFGDSIGRIGYAVSYPKLGISPLTYPRPALTRVKHFVTTLPLLSRPRITPATVGQWISARNNEAERAIPGFMPRPVETFHDNAEKRGQSHSKRLKSDGGIARNSEALFRLIRDLEQQGIRIIFVVTPAVDAYWEAVSPDASDHLAKVRTRIENESDATILDLSDSDSCGLAAADYFDADHLNTNGAIRFSRYLSIQIDALIGKPDEVQGTTQ